MVKLTRMNGLEFVVNAELIEFLESTPDTVMTLTTGKKFVLRDTVEEVVEKIIAYRKAIGAKIISYNAPEPEKAKSSDE